MSVNCSLALISGRISEKERKKGYFSSGKERLILDTFPLDYSIVNTMIFG